MPGLAGALQLPREPANLNMDLAVIADVFVVTIVGGLGSVPGAFIAALVIGIVKALCVGLGEQSVLGVMVSFPKLTLVAEFVVMAVVLVWRPWGLFGRAPTLVPTSEQAGVLKPPGRAFVWIAGALVVAMALAPLAVDEYTLVLATDILLFALFAVSLNFLMGPGGIASFGHAAYFGLGAYGAALLARTMSMEAALVVAPLAAGVGALICGWFCVRVSGVYLAMLTLAFAQIIWAIAYQWDNVTGGSNGLVGIWPATWLSSRAAYYWLTLALTSAAIACLWWIIFSPFGYALRAARDSSRRAAAVGIDVGLMRWAGFVIAGLFAGLAGSMYAFSKGSISPETLAIPRSIDGLVMVLLGGLQTLAGPIVGATVLTWLQDTVARAHRILARHSRRHHPAAGAGVSARHQRSDAPPAGYCDPGNSVMDTPLAGHRSLVESLWRRQGAGRCKLERCGRRESGHHWTERRRQEHPVQSHRRRDRARRRLDTIRRTLARRSGFAGHCAS